MSCGVGRRRGLAPVLLWLWRRPVATAPIRPLAWEPPYAAGVAQRNSKKTKKKIKKIKKIKSLKRNQIFFQREHEEPFDFCKGLISLAIFIKTIKNSVMVFMKKKPFLE